MSIDFEKNITSSVCVSEACNAIDTNELKSARVAGDEVIQVFTVAPIPVNETQRICRWESRGFVAFCGSAD